ncbi:MAG: hypothetical protein Q9195_007197 [Heterodermia aff. obscurata]
MRIVNAFLCGGYWASVLAAPLSLKSTSNVNSTDSNCVGINGLSPRCRPVEANHRREIFYVGGHYQLDPQTQQHVLVDQMYVEKLTPFPSPHQRYPLVFFHGGGYSGAAWLQTPDGRPGFASYFLKRGYQVYLIDQIGTGRSTQADLNAYPIKGAQSLETTLRGFTRMQDYNDYPQAKLHTQWPGSGQPGSPAFEALSSLAIPLTTAPTQLETSMRHAGCVLLSLLGPKSFLISHSIGALYPILLSDQCPHLIAGSLNLEPTTLPFESIFGPPSSPNAGRAPARKWGLANTPLTYHPRATTPEDLKPVRVGNDSAAKRSCLLQAEPARKLPNINLVPYVALTGEASQHAGYDHCIVEYLRQAGGTPEWIRLGEVGVRGNGHFGYLERNSEKIARVAEGWIGRFSR